MVKRQNDENDDVGGMSSGPGIFRWIIAKTSPHVRAVGQMGIIELHNKFEMFTSVHVSP